MDEVEHDLKQKDKFDSSAEKIKQFLANNEDKMGSQGKPIKSNIIDPDSAKMTNSKGTIQGYNGIVIDQVILQAQTWGSVGEQQKLKLL